MDRLLTAVFLQTAMILTYRKTGKYNLILTFRLKALSFDLWVSQQVKHVGETIFSSSRDKTIKVWQASKSGNEPISTFEGHRLVVTAIDLNEGNAEEHNFCLFVELNNLVI